VSGLLGEVETLFAGAVMSPDDLTEPAIADWFDGVASTTQLDKQAAKLLRRLVRTAQRLALFWGSDARVGDMDLDWRTRVDIAMGPRAWRPVLDLSQHLLEVDPSEETFDSVCELFRIVNGDVWLEGVGYEEWLQDAKRT
jgi:hypothetical protein